MARHVTKMLAFVALFTTCCGLDASAQGATYGDKPTYTSDGNFVYHRSDDGTAFTLILIDLGVGTSGESAPQLAKEGKIAKAIAKLKRGTVGNPPIASRVFSIVIPVKGGTPFKTTFTVGGSAVNNEGGRSTLVFTVNGQSTIRSFAPNSDISDSDFVQQVDYVAESTSEIRLTVFLLAERDGQAQGAPSTLLVDTIDTDLAIAQSRAAAAKAKRKK